MEVERPEVALRGRLVGSVGRGREAQRQMGLDVDDHPMSARASCVRFSPNGEIVGVTLVTGEYRFVRPGVPGSVAEGVRPEVAGRDSCVSPTDRGGPTEPLRPDPDEQPVRGREVPVSELAELIPSLLGRDGDSCDIGASSWDGGETVVVGFGGPQRGPGCRLHLVEAWDVGSRSRLWSEAGDWLSLSGTLVVMKDAAGQLVVGRDPQTGEQQGVGVRQSSESSASRLGDYWFLTQPLTPRGTRRAGDWRAVILRVVDAESGAEILTREGLWSEAVEDPTGRYLLVWDRSIAASGTGGYHEVSIRGSTCASLFSLELGTPVAALCPGEGVVVDARFSGDGTLVAAADSYGYYAVWRLE